jgi:hypothetical protein
MLVLHYKTPMLSFSEGKYQERGCIEITIIKLKTVLIVPRQELAKIKLIIILYEYICL